MGRAVPAAGGESREAASEPSRPWLRRGDRVGALRGGLSTVAFAVVVALLVRTFGVEPFRIPSESMLPTLRIGDHLFVNKLVFGAPIPFSPWRLPALREPRRGEVVVFTVSRAGGEVHPADRRPEGLRDRFVKRIVGLPGDLVEVRGGSVRVNGRALPGEATGARLRDRRGHGLQLYRERAGALAWSVAHDPALAAGEVLRFRVEPGRYFVLGDNREHSNDSRRWGTVRRQEIAGPAFLLYWSWDFEGSFAELLDPRAWWELLARKTRWERIGEPIG